MGGGLTQQFSASAYDQFGNALSSQPGFTWHVTAGTGSINGSGKYTATSSGTLATVTATATVSSTSFTGTAQAGVVSSPWTSGDIGGPGQTGTAYDNGTTFTVEGGGGDIWGKSDQFHFVYRTLTGDGVIIARVASYMNTGGSAKVGVMLRNSLSDNDQYALEAITPSNGSEFQYRTASAGSAAGTGGDSGPAAPYWVKLVRSGDTITGYRSADGNTWTADGTISITFTSSTIYVGLEVDANNNSLLNTSTFDNVALLAGGNSAPTVAQAANAATNPVTGTSVALSVLGADANPQSFLTYTWAATTVPSGAAAPTFSANTSNAAKNTTATFSAAGSYVFQVTITNEYALTVTSSVSVTVNQTASGSLIVFPGGPRCCLRKHARCRRITRTSSARRSAVPWRPRGAFRRPAAPAHSPPRGSTRHRLVPPPRPSRLPQAAEARIRRCRWYKRTTIGSSMKLRDRRRPMRAAEATPGRL